MLRLFLGLIKGLLLAGGIGYGAQSLGLVSGKFGFMAAGIAGLVVGFLCGKAPWRHETIFTPLIKGILGAFVAIGIFWVLRQFLGGLAVPSEITAALSLKKGAKLAEAPAILVGAVGAIYGAFVELDDGGKATKK
jgi:hypothetical protein